MYERILVPLDGSELAEQAVRHAVVQATQFGAEVVLLMVLGPLPETPMAGRQAVRKAEEMSAKLARDYLESVAEPMRLQEISVRIATVEGKPYVQIIEYAEEHGIDLIVMSARGYGGLSRWLLGSVADRVVRGARVPVLLIQARSGSPES
jgi:nucleotide-binding universal stress UspA family protein